MIFVSVKKENTLAYKYVKILRLFLYTVGGWPGEEFGEKVSILSKYHMRYIPVQATMLFCGQAYYIYTNFNVMDFFIKGDCFISIGLTAMTFVRGSVPWCKKYNRIVKTFLMSFHLGHHKHKGDYYMEMHNTISKLSYYYSLFSMFLMMCGMTLFNATPIFVNYKNGVFTSARSEDTIAYSIYFCFPGLNPMEYLTQTTIYNFYLTYVCASSVCAMDLLLFLMVFQIVGHIQILRNHFEILPKPKGVMFDAEENGIVRKKLIECIDHHREIVKFTEELSSFFGPVLGFNYTYHMGGCCLLMLECSQGDVDAIIRFGPLTFIMFGQLIQTSVIFEVVDTVSEKLKDSVYDIPWEGMDTRNRRLVGFLLNRVQSPLHVTAMGIIPVGVTTMTGILKTTFTYYAFLRSASA